MAIWPYGYIAGCESTITIYPQLNPFSNELVKHIINYGLFRKVDWAFEESELSIYFVTLQIE